MPPKKLIHMASAKGHSFQNSIIQAIKDIAVGPDRGRDISRELAQNVAQGILQGEIDEVQVSIFLIALRMKRESLDEFAGILDALIQATYSVEAEEDDVLVLADPFDGYVRTLTMTPFIPPILAALGLNVVIHGVRSVGPKFGVTAHKVYELAGCGTTESVQSCSKTLSEFGFCYVDQAQYAPSLYELNNLRGRMIKRTAITTLERVLMPIKGRKKTSLALGYVHKAYPNIYTKMAFQAGFDSVLLVKGVEGGLAPALNKPLRKYVFSEEPPGNADDHKIHMETPYSITSRLAGPVLEEQCAAVARCLELGKNVLTGQSGIARDSLVLASANILNFIEPELSLKQAVEKVKACLDNGSAAARFEAFCQ